MITHNKKDSDSAKKVLQYVVFRVCVTWLWKMDNKQGNGSVLGQFWSERRMTEVK